MQPIGEVERTAILKRVVPYRIHEDQNYKINYAWIDEPEGTHEMNIPAEATYPNPQPGDEVRLKMLMGIITSITKI